MDSIRGLASKGRAAAGKLGNVSDILTGEVATSIRNMLPDSDDTARPGFAGERHAILKLKNGKYGVANYMGPGTQIVKRLKRGDPGRTVADSVSMAHDIRYGLAKSQKDVAAADKKFIAALKRAQASRSDSRLNIQMGLKPIQAKMHAESLGLIKPGKIASFGDVAEGDRALVSSKLKELEQQGYGLMPGELLRMSAVKQLRRNSGKRRSTMNHRRTRVAMRGRGLDKKKVVKILADVTLKKLLPILLKRLGIKGAGLRLAGQRGTGKALGTALHMKMLSAINDGASRGKTRRGMAMHTKGAGIMPTGTEIKKMAHGAAKMILPVLISAVMTKAGLKQSGRGTFKNVQGQTVFEPSAFQKLTAPLTKMLIGAMSRGARALLKPRSTSNQGGTGAMSGAGFFSDFGKGFMKVWSPILKVAKIAAPLAPLLL